MPTSIRLDPRAERLLKRLARQRSQNRSEVVRAAIQLLAETAEEAHAGSGRATVYDQMEHVLGIADSGGAALSTRTGEQFRQVLVKRARERRSR